MTLANLFDLSKVINSYKNNQIPRDSLRAGVLVELQRAFYTIMEEIMGLVEDVKQTDNKLDLVIQTLIKLRQTAKEKKDFATSDAIRNELIAIGIQLKDEKDGTVSWTNV
jgi:cysteinyl-tRNA synthetase